MPPSLNPHPRRYHLKDVIVGKIFFMLVRIKVKHMELAIIRKETVGYAYRSLAPPPSPFDHLVNV